MTQLILFLPGIDTGVWKPGVGLLGGGPVMVLPGGAVKVIGGMNAEILFKAFKTCTGFPISIF